MRILHFGCAFLSNLRVFDVEVVERIKAVPTETRLLVVDPTSDQWYRERNYIIHGNLPSVRVLTSARDGQGSQQSSATKVRISSVCLR